MIMTPWIGSLSDKYGRKNLLTLPILLSAIPIGTRPLSFYYYYFFDLGRVEFLKNKKIESVRGVDFFKSSQPNQLKNKVTTLSYNR